ncbi:Cytochrome P450 [Elaphomyces granulatus]
MSMTFSWISIITGSLIFLAICLKFLFNKVFPRKSNVPTLPRVRTLLPFGIDYITRGIIYNSSNKNLLFWDELFTAHYPFKTLEIRLGPQTVITTRDPENVKALLTTQFGEFGKGERFHREWKDFLGDAIFTTDGEKWHASRALIRPIFSRERVSDLSTFEIHTQKLLRILDSPGCEQQPVNAFDLCLRLTMDIATDFLLGASVNSLANPADKFTAAFADVQRVQSWITMAGQVSKALPLQSFLFKDTYRNGLDTVNSFVKPFIMRTLALPRDEIEAIARSDKGYNFVTALAAFTRDPKMIRDQLISVLLAARDTTAATLAWTLYELSGRPEIVKHLREEILETVGLVATATYADLKNMRYLQAILKETLRLYPAIPFNMRAALSDTTLPRGGGPQGDLPVNIKKDTLVAYSPLYMQRRSELYPATYPDGTPFPDPSQYTPERWIYSGVAEKESKAANKADSNYNHTVPAQVDNHGVYESGLLSSEAPWIPKPWTYIPFNGGPRICIGQQFALAEMGYTLVKIFQKYSRLERRMKQEDCDVMRANIVLTPARGVTVVFLKN